MRIKTYTFEHIEKNREDSWIRNFKELRGEGLAESLTDQLPTISVWVDMRTIKIPPQRGIELGVPR